MVSLEKTLEVDDGDDDDKDRISNLPDHILTHILSFLPTKYAVGTTILSTRWKYFFTTIPNLDFDDSKYFFTTIPNIDFDDSLFEPEEQIIIRKRCNSFINFVYRVLLLRNSTSNVTKFRLNCYREYDESHVSTWICAVLRRNVQQLHISIPMKKICTLPSDIFICKSLVVLKLRLNFLLNVPSTVCLPNLKVLSLFFVTFTDEDSIQRVFSACPVLEELDLDMREMNNSKNFYISIPSLKSLVLYFCGHGYEIVLDTPMLECFKYSDYAMGVCTLKNTKSLVKAHLDLILTEEELEDDAYRYAQNAAMTVNEVKNVKFLHLTDNSLAALEYSCCSLPTFHNLTHLKLGANPYGWQLLPNLLESSPNLEVLVFDKGFVAYDDEGTAFTEFLYCLPEHVPICLSQHLKEIEIEYFCGEENELVLVEYFLMNGEVLKKMTIKCESPLDPFPEWIPIIPHIRERILMFPRSSQTCQIVVSSAEF